MSYRLILRRLAFVLFCFALLLGCVSAQESASGSNSLVPNLVKYSGSISGAPAGTTGVIFALYKDQTGGAPLWQEVQNVTVDGNGRYTALLGSSTTAGIPLDVFSSNEARWLGAQVQGQAEQARVLLVSVPYALKAADAQTLGGLPASAFLLANGAAVGTAPASAAYVNTAAVNTAAHEAVAASVASVAGNLPVFTDGSGDLGSSLVSQVSLATGGAGNFVGINTAAPAADLHIFGVNPTLRMEQYGPLGSGDSPNFNFYTGNGTAASPTATQDADNLGQFAASGYNGTGFGGSKVKVAFVAVGPWTATSNGTAMSFQTTSSADATAKRTERLRIADSGNVGIGNFAGATPPQYPLTVNGIVKSNAGYMFPDGTTQTSGVPSCAANQFPKWIGTGWSCFTSPAAGSLVLDAAPNAGLVGNLTANVLTLGIDPTAVQDRISGTCSSGSAIASISQTGTVSCQTVSGGGAVSTPVNWTGVPNPPTTVQGVLNVANTAAGIADSQSGPPVFADIPSAVVGKATGTSGITAGVAGIATGPSGVGVVAYTTESSSPTLVAWSAVTGYTPTGGKGDYPKAIDAMLYNETGGNVIEVEADAATAPAPCSGSNCQQLTGVNVNMNPTSGVTVGLSANLNSPYSQGINLNFQTPLAAGTQSTQGGSMINANVNGGGYFQVDGSGNIQTSGGLTANGPSNLNGQVNANNGFNAQNVNVPGQIIAGSITVQNLQVMGNLSKPQGTFKIDHPLDPANKFLYHSFVESPDMMNIYNGNIVTDKHGVATVQLPDYFEALNQDFRYQLTVIGQFAQAIVVKEISKNHFTIKTNKPSVKVSWQVTGIRHDAYAEAHRIQVEEDKGKERGTYLHPELFQKDPVLAQK